MESTLLPMPVPGFASLPAVLGSDEHSQRRFIEFFTVNIRNRNTRRAYAAAAVSFFDWCDAHHLTLATVQSFHVSVYIEELLTRASKQTVKQHLAALRSLFDWLVVGQVVAHNPALSVRGPRYSTAKGKTPVMSAEETRELLDSLDTSSIVGLRDRALIGIMTYTFARVGAVVTMKVQDYFPQTKRWWVRLQEKNGKLNQMPCHHNLKQYLDEYLEAAGISADRTGPLFRTVLGKTGKLTNRPMRISDVYRMIQRRAAEAGIETKIGCHTFRATGITAYLKNGRKLEIAQQMAGHSNPKTTSLYDRRNDEVSMNEVERILI
jgi:integrase/recombinase XerD